MRSSCPSRRWRSGSCGRSARSATLGSRTACPRRLSFRTGCVPCSPSLYLIYNEGHTASSGSSLVRTDLCAEAVRLARLLAELMPDEPEVMGLLALLLLTDARRPARVAADGSLVLLADQDRSLWDRSLIAEGQDLVRACLRRNQPGPYQIQAAIAAVHSDALRAGGHRLGADPRLVRPAHGRAAEPGRRAQPCRRVGGDRRRGVPRCRSSTRSTSTPTCRSTSCAPTCSSSSAIPLRRCAPTTVRSS